MKCPKTQLWKELPSWQLSALQRLSLALYLLVINLKNYLENEGFWLALNLLFKIGLLRSLLTQLSFLRERTWLVAHSVWHWCIPGCFQMAQRTLGDLSTCFTTLGEHWANKDFLLVSPEVSRSLVLGTAVLWQIHSKRQGIHQRFCCTQAPKLLELIKYNLGFLTAKNLPGCKHGPAVT